MPEFAPSFPQAPKRSVIWLVGQPYFEIIGKATMTAQAASVAGTVPGVYPGETTGSRCGR